MRQALESLVTNAAEALAGAPGEIVVGVTTAEVPVEVPDRPFHLAPAPGQYVCLSVRDTGPGMSADVRAHMFDPFLSTKFTGRGLGLAPVLGILRAHNGGISVRTAPGQGTAFAVYWPAAASPVAEPHAGEHAPAAGPAKAALVIDDEMFVREVPPRRSRRWGSLRCSRPTARRASNCSTDTARPFEWPSST